MPSVYFFFSFYAIVVYNKFMGNGKVIRYYKVTGTQLQRRKFNVYHRQTSVFLYTLL